MLVVSLEAARTRARLQAAYAAQMLPEDNKFWILGYPLAPICVSPVTSRIDARRQPTDNPNVISLP